MMKRLMFRLSKLLLALLLAPLFTFGQRPNEQDVQLFKTYFYDSLAVGLDFKTFATLNGKLERVERHLVQEQYASKSFKKLKLRPEFNVIQTQVIRRNGWFEDVSVYPDTTVNQDFIHLYRSIHSTDERPLEYGMKVKRERMKRYMRTFKTKATTLPLFYAIIDKAYGGNIDAYVDDLFDHSIFATSGSLTRYRNYSLSSLRLRIDPLVVYSICCAQYVKEPAPRSNTDIPEELADVVPQNIPSTDKELFRSYFMDSVWIKVDLITMNNVYTFKKKDDNLYNMWSSNKDSYWGVHFAPSTWWPDGYNPGFYSDEKYSLVNISTCSKICSTACTWALTKPRTKRA